MGIEGVIMMWYWWPRMKKWLKNNTLLMLLGCFLALFVVGAIAWQRTFSIPKELTFSSVWTTTDREQITEIYESMKTAVSRSYINDSIGWADITNGGLPSKLSFKVTNLIIQYNIAKGFQLFADTVASGEVTNTEQDEGNMNFLYAACSYGKNGLVKHLLEIGANPNMPNLFPNGTAIRLPANTVLNTPLWCAVRDKEDKSDIPVESRLELVRILAKHGADLNQKAGGLVPFEFACMVATEKNQYEKVACLILELGADPNLGGNYPLFDGSYGVRRHPLSVPISCTCSDVVQIMLEKGISPNADTDEIPLTMACQKLVDSHGNLNSAIVRILRLLLDHGANLDAAGSLEDVLKKANPEAIEELKTQVPELFMTQE